MKLTVVLAFGAATLGFGMGKQRGTTTKPSVAQSPSIVGQSSPMQQFAPLQPAPPARTSRKMTKDIPLAAADQEVLKQDPKTEAIKEMDDTRQMRLSECRATIANPTQELCERILQANGHAIQRSIEIKQRFLRGEIDQDTFQSEFHKMFLLRSVELEHILSAKDFLSHEHIPVGQDTFMAILSGPMAAKGFHLGDELLDPELKSPQSDTVVASGQGSTTIDGAEIAR